MTETCGGTGITPFRNPDFKPGIKNPIDDLEKMYQKRKLVKQEMRKKELEEKGENGQLNTREALELSSYKMEEALEKLALLKNSAICYNA